MEWVAEARAGVPRGRRHGAAADAPAHDQPIDDAARLPLAVYIGSGLINLLGLALPLLVLWVFDRIIPDAALASLTVFVLGMAGVVILDASLRIARAYVVGWIDARRHYELAVEAADRLVHAPPAMLARDTPGLHLEAMAALDTIGVHRGGQFRLALLDLSFVVMALMLLGMVAGWLVLVPIIVMIALGSVAWHRQSVLRHMAEAGARHDGQGQDFILQCLSGIASVKAMAMEPQLVARFERHLKEGAGRSAAAMLVANEAEAGAHLFAGLAIVGTVTAGAVQVMGGSLSLGALAAAALLAGAMVEPLLAGVVVWAQARTAEDVRARIRHLFELPPRAPNPASPLVDCRGAVSVRNLSFAYGLDEPLILKDAELRVAPGEMIGLRGGDGSGKSTLLALMRGDLVPSNGEVRIDGYEACGLHRRALAGIVASVSEAPALLHGTILENIALFGGHAANDAAREAARLVGLDPVVARLPRGYDTMVGDTVCGFVSEGLAQRIAIARALARKPQVILFDEADSALDAQAERCLCGALAGLKGKATVILVSRRAALLRLADRTVVLDDGRLWPATADRIDPAMPPQGAP